MLHPWVSLMLGTCVLVLASVAGLLLVVRVDPINLETALTSQALSSVKPESRVGVLVAPPSASPTFMDRVTRKLWDEHRTMLATDQSTYEAYRANITSSDLTFVLTSHYLLPLYRSWLNATEQNEPWRTDDERLKVLRQWYADYTPKPEVSETIPDTFGPEMVNFMLRHIDFYDVLTRATGGGAGENRFVIDTSVINGYSLRERYARVSSRYGFVMRVRSTAVGFVMEDLDGTATPTAEQCALWREGAALINTCCSHGVFLHAETSAFMTLQNQAFLPEAHPLRLVLAPTDLRTVNAAARARGTLFVPGRGLDKSYVLDTDGFTSLFDEFRRPLLETATEWCGPTFRASLSLTGGELAAQPWRDLNRWHGLIRSFAEDVVATLVPLDEHVVAWAKACAPTVTQPTAETVTVLLAYAYFSQVRHNLMSNSTRHLLNLNMRYEGLSRELAPTRYSYLVDVLYLLTSVPWTKITADQSSLAAGYPALQARWRRFYADLASLSVDRTVNPMLQPSLVESSSGF